MDIPLLTEPRNQTSYLDSLVDCTVFLAVTAGNVISFGEHDIGSFAHILLHFLKGSLLEEQHERFQKASIEYIFERREIILGGFSVAYISVLVKLLVQLAGLSGQKAL